MTDVLPDEPALVVPSVTTSGYAVRRLADDAGPLRPDRDGARPIGRLVRASTVGHDGSDIKEEASP